MYNFYKVFKRARLTYASAIIFGWCEKQINDFFVSSEYAYKEGLKYIDDNFNIYFNSAPDMKYFCSSEFKPQILDNIFIIPISHGNKRNWFHCDAFLLKENILACRAVYNCRFLGRNTKVFYYYYIFENGEWKEKHVGYNPIQKSLENWDLLVNFLDSDTAPINLTNCEILHRALNDMNVYGVRKKKCKSIPPDESKLKNKKRLELF